MTLTADQWNARYPEGTAVIAYPGYRPEHAPPGWPPASPLTTTTRSRAWALPSGYPVVMVDGEPGGIALDHVDPARP